MQHLIPSVSILIPTQIGSFSCVGVDGEFPRGFGNYISLYDKTTKEKYLVVNLSYEDLEDAIKLGIIGDTIEADVYQVDNNKIAFITDTRLPEKARSPRWWYSYRADAKEAILRKEFNIYSDECLCKNHQTKYLFMSNTSITFPSQEKPFKTFTYQCSCGYKEIQQIPVKM